jgi:hypothetical protein
LEAGDRLEAGFVSDLARFESDSTRFESDLTRFVSDLSLTEKPQELLVRPIISLPQASTHQLHLSLPKHLQSVISMPPNTFLSSASFISHSCPTN